jgi:transcriptional regulator with PAS, ATPase and Fis domain
VQFIGESAAMREVLEKIKLLSGQGHLNVLILGESGTGKEVIARLLHQQEQGAQRPFVIVNMPAIPSTLMESELFGVEKGAFTDAKVARAGKFEQADGGDIFLDEIGDLPLETQSKILRALQEKQIERIGSHRSTSVQFRVISATNRPLADLMSGGEFREDLIYRLSDMVLWIPPLRDRKEDIPALANHFIQKYFRGADTAAPRLSERALQTLLAYHWPGNVRQLESTIKRALVFNRGAILDDVEIYDPAMFNPCRTADAPPATLEQQLEQYERRIIQDALRRHSGNRDAVMQELAVSRATFYRRILRLEIQLD